MDGRAKQSLRLLRFVGTDETGQSILRHSQLEPPTGIIGRVGQQRFEKGDGLAVGCLRLTSPSCVAQQSTQTVVPIREVHLVLGFAGELGGQGLANLQCRTKFLLRLGEPPHEGKQATQFALCLGEPIAVLGLVGLLTHQLLEKFTGLAKRRFRLFVLPQFALDLTRTLLGLRRLELDGRVGALFGGQLLIEGQGLFQELLLDLRELRLLREPLLGELRVHVVHGLPTELQTLLSLQQGLGGLLLGVGRYQGQLFFRISRSANAAIASDASWLVARIACQMLTPCPRLRPKRPAHW